MRHVSLLALTMLVACEDHEGSLPSATTYGDAAASSSTAPDASAMSAPAAPSPTGTAPTSGMSTPSTDMSQPGAGPASSTCQSTSPTHGRWKLTFTRQPAKAPCDEQFAMNQLRPFTMPLVMDLDAPTQPPGGENCSFRASPPGSCAFRWWHNCLRFFAGTGEAHFERLIEGRLVTPTRFEGTAMMEYLVASRCVENYAVVGVPTTEPVSPSVYVSGSGGTSATTPAPTQGCPDVKAGELTWKGCCTGTKVCGGFGRIGSGSEVCQLYESLRLLPSLGSAPDPSLDVVRACGR
jgi:hypothetical protein